MCLVKRMEKVQGIENITLMLLLIEVEWWKSLDAIFFFLNLKEKKMDSS